MRARDRSAWLAGRLGRTRGQEPEQHGQERADSEHEADDQQDEHLRVRPDEPGDDILNAEV